MKNWALTSVACESPDRYRDEVTPLTWPIMEAYAARHEMAWQPKIISRYEYNDFAGKGTAPHGTASVYASIPHRRALLDQYDGVVFLDSDNIIMAAGMESDLCEAVSDEQPICTEPACNCAVMVLKSCAKTKEMLDHIWAVRHAFCHYQWLEQAVYMELMGYDPKYPGDNKPPVWLGATEWTPLLAPLPTGWNAHPLHPLPDPLRSVHPGGFQPFERRLEEIKRWISQACGTVTSSTTGGENP